MMKKHRLQNIADIVEEQRQEIERLTDQVRKLKDENERRKQALKEYGVHFLSCDNYGGCGVCDCGLDKALAEKGSE